MDKPFMSGIITIAPDTEMFAAYIPVPGYGILPVNSFLIKGKEPVLIDTSVAVLGDEFIKLLQSQIDTTKIRWLWITHTDPDHVGNLKRVLDIVPNARVVTDYLGLGKLSLHQFLIEKPYLINPGQTLHIKDRQLLCVKPISYDAPETIGLFDMETKIIFSADSFGALLSKPAQGAASVSSEELQNGIHFWTQVDSPWFSYVNKEKVDSVFSEFRLLNSKKLLSSHLPVVEEDMIETVLENLLTARSAPSFVGPDQATLEKKNEM